LLVDAERGFGNGKLLPRGPLREPLSAVARADVVVISKANLGDAARVRRELEAPGVAKPIFRCAHVPGRLRRVDGKGELPASALAGTRVTMVCGIAQPGGFGRTLAAAGATVGNTVTFPDHHKFSAGDLAALDAQMSGASPERVAWVTTEKDATK